MKLINFLAHNLNVDRSTKLLNGIHGFVVENIKMRIDVIFEPWEIIINVGKVNTWIQSLEEYLKDNLNSDETQYIHYPHVHHGQV